MTSRARLAVLAAVLAAGAVAGFALTGSKGAAGGSRPATLPSSTKSPVLPPQCLQVPPAVAAPSWYPKDLPMPAGSFVSEVPAASAGLRRVIFTVNGGLRDFVRHALKVWPAQGWQLGRGESEPGEAEDQFIKGKTRYGLFKAQSAYCDVNRTWVLIVLSDPTTLPSATPKPTASK